MNIKQIASSLSLIFLVVLTGCGNEEQEKELKRQQRIEQQEQQDKATAQAKAEAERAQAERLQQEATPPEPETPVEPEKVTEYVIDGRVVCTCSTTRECGVSFWNCGDGKFRACMHNVIYTTIETTKNKSNDVDCGTD